MKLEHLLEGLQIKKVQGSLSLDISNIHYDSRLIKPGGLFVAFKGEHEDGHSFIGQAKENGATAILTHIKFEDEKVTIIQVENTKDVLPGLACRFYENPSLKVPVIGITGTNGKTTITYLIESILKENGLKPAVIGTVNYRFQEKTWNATHTTPQSLDLQRLLSQFVEMGATHIIMEVSSHALSQRRVEGVHFDVAVFTNLTRDHLDYHKTFEEYYVAKKSFFTDYLKNSKKKNKASIINGDDSYGQKLLLSLDGRGQGEGEVSLLSFGLHSEKALFQAHIREMNVYGTKAFIKTPRWSAEIKTNLVGEHNLSNIVAALCAASHLKISQEKILRGIENLKNIPGRLEKVEAQDGPQVFVDYAHTDDALKNVLKALHDLKPQGKIITVFGCGGDRDKTKRPLMGKVAQENSDVIFVTSDNPRTEDPLSIIEDIKKGLTLNSSVMIEADRTQAIYKAISLAKKEDVVLIAGKGHEDYQILGTQKIHFDDREKALECLSLK
ncbi:MAG: UDP-N-acetylmuramoyl-L-alanyl-D-glutamate--2,6-diaminopimelate ligase [Deltaproteobacteria bacterium]|nr:UDP-N-acetylmuramoyl-L-alanyl-D-glutamate--2,6-diaminopimelate ligase [Deltaproteobacteria bacterium]